MQIFDIANTVVTLDDHQHARALPVTSTFWEDLGAGRLGQFSRMISCFSFDQDWTTWEKHPAGEEFVCLLEGDVDLVLDEDGRERIVTLNHPGTYLLVPTNTWHTARVRKPTKMLFVTPGEGTENKPI